MSRAKRAKMFKAAPVGRLIEGLLKSKGLDGKLKEFRTWLVWDEAVGPQIAARARPIRIRDGILEVRVAHPVWMQQLQLLKPQLLKKINARLEGASIKDIFLRRGNVESAAEKEPELPEKRWQDAVLDKQEQQQIEKSLQSLDDNSELRQHLQQLLVRQAKLEKTRRQDSP